MFGFGKKRNSTLVSLVTPSRDNIIGSIANLIDQLLPKKGYKIFSTGYIFIGDILSDSLSVGWGPSDNQPHSVYFFCVKDVEIHPMLMDDIFGKTTGIERTMIVDMYCAGVHKLLLENLPLYLSLKYSDRRLS